MKDTKEIIGRLSSLALNDIAVEQLTEVFDTLKAVKVDLEDKKIVMNLLKIKLDKHEKDIADLKKKKNASE